MYQNEEKHVMFVGVLITRQNNEEVRVTAFLILFPLWFQTH